MEFRGSNGKPIGKGVSLYEVPFNVLGQKLTNKAANAKSNNRKFEIKTIIDIMTVMNKSEGRCFYTGQLFADASDITFERIDPNLGYTVENTAFTNVASNSCKAHLDAFEKENGIPDEVKIKLLNKLVYRLTKRVKKEKANAESERNRPDHSAVQPESSGNDGSA